MFKEILIGRYLNMLIKVSAVFFVIFSPLVGPSLDSHSFSAYVRISNFPIEWSVNKSMTE